MKNIADRILDRIGLIRKTDWRKNAHNNFNPDREGKSKYLTFVDLMAHEDIGNKTMLFLIEAALADNPPSKAKYDPQRNNAGISSLGVMEHRNNAKEKKYSRNLGKKEGIELVQKSIPVK